MNLEIAICDFCFCVWLVVTLFINLFSGGAVQGTD